jgi:hypothetical protein
MQPDRSALLRRVLAELQIDSPVYRARSFADGRVEVVVYGGRKFTWPDDVRANKTSVEPPEPLEPAILARPPAQSTSKAVSPDRDMTPGILAALGTGPLHKLSVTHLRHLAYLAGLHPSARLKSIRKSQLVRELSEYRALSLRDSAEESRKQTGEESRKLAAGESQKAAESFRDSDETSRKQTAEQE